MAKEYGFLVNGKWMKGEKKREVKSPYNDEVVGVINIPAPKEAIDAIDGAEKAFEKFKNAPSYDRREILRKNRSRNREEKRRVCQDPCRRGWKAFKNSKDRSGSRRNDIYRCIRGGKQILRRRAYPYRYYSR
jgi:NAD-dependent aldehyde dehydrogenases